MAKEITTIKIIKKTKARLDNLKEYKHETYEEIISKMLDLMNLFKTSPEEAASRLKQIDSKRKALK